MRRLSYDEMDELTPCAVCGSLRYWFDGDEWQTPDDMGWAQRDGELTRQPRARQNVVLEMGMVLAALGRPNVAILKKGHIETPSDAQGIIYLSFNDHIRETVPRLVDRLRQAGFTLAPEAITKAAS